MKLSLQRIQQDIEAIAGFTSTPGAGRSCPTFSPQWRSAVEYVTGKLKECGCDVQVDPTGNIRARPKSVSWDTPAWMVGSHIDSVPNGGDFDGVAGVVIPLEIIRASQEQGHDGLPIELVIFTEEEGTTFGNGMLGSLSWVGKLDSESPELTKAKNENGQTFFEAGKDFGVKAEELSSHEINPKHYRGMIEVHIEQGPSMWRNETPVAIVNGIAGRRQWRVAVQGQANHAGSTPMPERHDSLAAAAEMILELEKLAPRLSDRAVITVGRFAAHPSAVNVINGQVEFTIDFRDPSNEVLGKGEVQIEEVLKAIAENREVGIQVELTESLVAMALDEQVCSRLASCAETAVKDLGIDSIPVTQSGALHDAAIIAEVIPTAMMFVASRDGISHNPAEYSRVEDLKIAGEIIGNMIALDQ